MNQKINRLPVNMLSEILSWLDFRSQLHMRFASRIFFHKVVPMTYRTVLVTPEMRLGEV
jgi:hypothetical protein